MNIPLGRRLLLILAVGIVPLTIASSHGAVSVSISPSIIADDFNGKVSVTILGLPVGKSVLLERFTDVNGNGAVDLGQDALTLSVAVADGVLPLVGGVRNTNMPGDDDGAVNGAMRIDLPFPGPEDVLGTAVGKVVFRVSDPQNSFPAALAGFQVTRKTQPQGVSGRITSASGASLAAAFVVLGTTNGSPVAAMLTDANGNYSFPSPPGSFTVFVAQNGFVSDITAGAVTVAANQFATKNVALSFGGSIVSGKVTDSSSGLGIGGVFVAADATSNKFAGVLTDAAGNYTLSLTADQWKIGPVPGVLAQLGYVRSQPVITTTASGGSTTLNFPLVKATALIFGNITDGGKNPVYALKMQAHDFNNTYKAEGISVSPNGTYALGVLAGNWVVEPQSESLIARGYTSSGGVAVTLSTGQARQADFVLQAVTAHLRGQVRDSTGAPIPFITLVVQPVPLDPTGAGSLYLSTDSNGNFDAGVRGGTWNIALECVEAQIRSFVNVYGINFTVTDGVDQNGIALSFPGANAKISGSLKDKLGQPIAGVDINASQAQALNANRSYAAGCVATDTAGNYSLKVIGGTWNVSVDAGGLSALGYNSVASQNVTINAGAATANFVTSLLPPEIISPTSATGAVGQQFVYQFETRFPATLRVASLPAGLTFNSTLSAIVGTPTAAGNFQVGLTATNNTSTTTATLTITIKPIPSSGPVITSSTSATGRVGQAFSFQVTTSGATAAARLTVTGLPAGLTADGVTGLISGKPGAEGSFPITITAADGNFSTTAILQLTFTSDPALPVIVSPSQASVAAGQAFTYAILAPTSTPSDPVTYSLLGTLPSGLGFDPFKGTISGTYTGRAITRAVIGPGGNGNPLSGGVITNVQLFATNSRGTTTLPLIFFVAPAGVVNIATRLSIGVQENVLIGGFIITGNAPKKVIIRGMGPSLKSGGVPVPGAVQDPILELREGNTLLGSNDDWRTNQEQEIIDTGVPPPDNREAAIIATLNPGAYTAVVSGKGQTTGIGLVELYDLGTASLDTSSSSKLANISTRGFVQRLDDVMIGGFIVSGTASRVIVRAIGPSLTASGITGALQDTTLDLFDGNGSLISSNDDWRIGGQEQQIIDTTVQPKDNRESAIVAILNPGAYTAIVRGKGSTTGVALVEAYVLP